jgi:hypothetical protein
MSFSNWLNRIAPRKTSKRDRSCKAKPRRFRPVQETLEDRCVPATWTVKNLLDNGDPNDLRSLIMAAAPGDIVAFQNKLNGTISLQMGELVINKSITIDATHATNIVIDAHYASNVFDIFGAASPGITVGLTNLTIEHDSRGSYTLPPHRAGRHDGERGFCRYRSNQFLGPSAAADAWRQVPLVRAGP